MSGQPELVETARPTWKIPADLVPGDLIAVNHPSGTARVVKAYQLDRTRAVPGGQPGYGPEAELAWIVDFEMTTGSSRGKRLYTYQHPLDRIRIA